MRIGKDQGEGRDRPKKRGLKEGRVGKGKRDGKGKDFSPRQHLLATRYLCHAVIMTEKNSERGGWFCKQYHIIKTSILSGL